MIYILLLVAILGFIAAGVWYASHRRPKPLPPPVIGVTPTLNANWTVTKTGDGHIYRMRLPDRLRMEHHRSTR